MDNGMNFFRTVMEQKTNKDDRRRYQLRALKGKRAQNWDILTESAKYALRLLGVQSSDGKSDHAICVVGKYIFDSNFERALDLTRESLDLCCSLDDKHTPFVRVTRGYLLEER